MSTNELRVRQHDPTKPIYGPRLDQAEWERIRPLLTQLHDQGLPRHKIIEIAKQQHGFTGTESVLNKKSKQWGLSRASSTIAHRLVNDDLAASGSQSADDAGNIHEKEDREDLNAPAVSLIHAVSTNGIVSRPLPSHPLPAPPHVSEIPLGAETGIKRVEILDESVNLKGGNSQTDHSSPRVFEDSEEISSLRLPATQYEQGKDVERTVIAGIAKERHEEKSRSAFPAREARIDHVRNVLSPISSPADMSTDDETTLQDFLTPSNSERSYEVPIYEVDKTSAAATTITVAGIPPESGSTAYAPAGVPALDAAHWRHVVDQIFLGTKRPRSLVSSVGSSRFSGSSDGQSFVRLAKRLRGISALSDLTSLLRWSKASSTSSLRFSTVSDLKVDTESQHVEELNDGTANDITITESTETKPEATAKSRQDVSYPSAPFPDLALADEIEDYDKRRTGQKAVVRGEIVDRIEGWTPSDGYFESTVRSKINKALADHFKGTGLRYRLEKNTHVPLYTQRDAIIVQAYYEAANMEGFIIELSLKTTHRFVVIEPRMLETEHDFVLRSPLSWDDP